MLPAARMPWQIAFAMVASTIFVGAAFAQVAEIFVPDAQDLAQQSDFDRNVILGVTSRCGVNIGPNKLRGSGDCPLESALAHRYDGMPSVDLEKALSGEGMSCGAHRATIVCEKLYDTVWYPKSFLFSHNDSPPTPFQILLRISFPTARKTTARVNVFRSDG